ncbi:hypothetical protein [Metabacillus fastidiosus]|uniref:hypothetical protein n=1 Tax=Metabacillus fastidiosus TaxID=1458 RepID=UPI003D2D3AF7
MKLTVDYINWLKNKFYSILLGFEKNEDNLTTTIGSFIYHIEGLQIKLDEDKQSTINTLLVTLEHLYDDSLQAEYDLSIIRREILNCMNLIGRFFKVGD